MSLVREMIERLMAGGADAITAAEVVTQAFILGAQSVTPVASPVTRSAAAARQARYRERNAAKAETVTQPITRDAPTPRRKTVTRDVPAITEPTPSRPSPPDPPNPPIPAQSDIFACDDAPVMAAGKPMRKFLMPHDWEPDSTNWKYGSDHGMTDDDIRRQTIEFRDWAINKQERRPGWDRSWQQWVRRWADGTYQRAPRPTSRFENRAASHDRRTDAMLAGAASAFGTGSRNS